ncbi:Suppressor of fused protein (SUFU) [Streptomyces sp. 1222.5]|uniref:suppressor of fused domain protein n=1 Tax=unclassified Streptomyces TaxID=2593676 RepID=UPI00089B379C|nr:MULTISPECIES: suppressor of fused domain protein [unclassified Streptomyces]PKW05985.1 suppressor of fused protein SUFU [Streptomyces sp. 5112.2]SED23865.1 Suppressor of fused protein (SUFU) [Streptomyces sp. 1222.5]
MPVDAALAARAALREHLHQHFPGQVIDELPGAEGPIAERVPDFRVFRVHPNRPGGWWVYVTSGCWAATQQDGHGTEFFLAAPRDEWLNLESVSMNAYYHCGPNHQRLDVGHTVPIGRPWLDDSRCDHYLISLPYPYGPDYEVCAWDDTAHARILWLLPITKAEKDYRREQGLEALESLFDERAIDPVDPQRPSVV